MFPHSVHIGFRLFVLSQGQGRQGRMYWVAGQRYHSPRSSSSFLDMPCRDTNRRRYTGQQPGTKSARGPGDKPLIYRLSTGRQPDVLFLQRFTLDFLCSCFRRVVQDSCFRCFGRQEGQGVSWVNRPVGVPLYQAPPRPAVRRSDPTRPWCVRVLDSTGLVHAECNVMLRIQ